MEPACRSHRGLLFFFSREPGPRRETRTGPGAYHPRMPEAREHGPARSLGPRSLSLRDSDAALEPPDGSRRPALTRALLIGSGWVAIGLAILGVALPLVPTTPFVLLAAACFARSSPRLHRRLLESRLGPLLIQWRERRSVPRSAKRRAYALVVVSFTASILLVDRLALRLVLACLGCALLVVLWRLPGETEGDVPRDARRGERP